MLFFFAPKSDQKEIILTILITVEAEGHEEQEKYPLGEIYENKTNFSALNLYKNISGSPNNWYLEFRGERVNITKDSFVKVMYNLLYQCKQVFSPKCKLQIFPIRKAWEKTQKVDSLMATWSLPVFSQDTQPLMSGSITQLFQVTHPLGQKSKKKKPLTCESTETGHSQHQQNGQIQVPTKSQTDKQGSRK